MYGNPYIMSPAFQQFQPNFQQQFQAVQPMQPMQTMQSPTAPAFSVVQVPTIEHVEQIQLQPEEKKIVLVQNQPVLAMRTADAMGLVSTRYFTLSDYDPHAQQASAQPEYAPFALVQDMQTQIADITQQIADMKGAISNVSKSSVKRNTATATADT